MFFVSLREGKIYSVSNIKIKLLHKNKIFHLNY